MSLYALADLHFSQVHKKTMSRFGPAWDNHTQQIEKNWNATVTEQDTVIVAGDITWASRLEDAIADLSLISRLHGKKIIVKGNHDFFWGSTARLNQLYDNLIFLQGSYTLYKDYAICGTRGWLCPGDRFFTTGDNRLYRREAQRLQAALQAAASNGHTKMIAVTHYAPTNDKREDSLFTDLFNAYPVPIVVYGHLHGIDSFYASRIGVYQNTSYYLTSCDYTRFSPIKILD